MYSRAFKENDYKNNDRVKKSPKNVCHAAGVTTSSLLTTCLRMDGL